MSDVRVDEGCCGHLTYCPKALWIAGFSPTGRLSPLANPNHGVCIQDARHEITAPVSGRLTILAAANALVNGLVSPG